MGDFSREENALFWFASLCLSDSDLRSLAENLGSIRSSRLFPCSIVAQLVRKDSIPKKQLVSTELRSMRTLYSSFDIYQKGRSVSPERGRARISGYHSRRNPCNRLCLCLHVGLKFAPPHFNRFVSHCMLSQLRALVTYFSIRYQNHLW